MRIAYLKSVFPMRRKVPVSSLSFIGVALLYFFIAQPSCPGAVTFNWLTVGDPGNAADSTGYGSVAATYRISAYEVRNDQYAEFLNAVADSDPNGLYNSNMDISRSGSDGSYSYSVNSGFDPNPVNYVSFLDAMRFVNWLENGQPTGAQGLGTTEGGVYTIGSGTGETRAGGASYFIPSEDEWYKAAYYDPGTGPGDNYWLYPTQSDTAPTGEAPPGGANSANFNSAVGGTTDVGAYTGTTSYYGAFDMGGNVWEWNEVIGSSRGLRGGSWNVEEVALRSSFWLSIDPSLEVDSVGFRVASSFDAVEAVPEPGTVGLVGLGCLVMGALRNRTRRC